MDVIENSEILADGTIGAAAFACVQPITNMGGAVQTGSSKANQIKDVNNRLGGGGGEENRKQLSGFSSRKTPQSKFMKLVFRTDQRKCAQLKQIILSI